VKKHFAQVAAPAGLGRRADQPGSLGVVSPRGRRGPLPDRRHLVADRDRRHPDHAAARRHAAKPGSATKPFFGVSRRWSTTKATSSRGHRPAICACRQLAGPDAHVYGDHSASSRPISATYQGQVLHRRRLPPRRGRLLLDHRPRRRRDQRLRPPHGHRRSRSALVAHPKVAEAAVVGYPHDIKGQGIYAYVTLMAGEPDRRPAQGTGEPGCARRSARSPRRT
jgi:hypothetical protein